MAHDHHRHDHDKGLMAKLHWLFLIGHFWMSDVNRAVVDLADPKPGERGLDVGAGMGPATVLAAKRGAHVVAVDPSAFMRAFCGFRRLLQRARARITVESGVAEDLPVAGGSTEVLWAVNAVHHWVDHGPVHVRHPELADLEQPAELGHQALVVVVSVMVMGHQGLLLGSPAPTGRQLGACHDLTGCGCAGYVRICRCLRIPSHSAETRCPGLAA